MAVLCRGAGIERRGAAQKKTSFMCTWEEWRTKGEDEDNMPGSWASAGGSFRRWRGVRRVYVLSPLPARIVLLSCCVRMCDAMRAESMPCVLDEKPNSQGDFFFQGKIVKEMKRHIADGTELQNTAARLLSFLVIWLLACFYHGLQMLLGTWAYN